MSHKFFQKIQFSDLSQRQKKTYNFHKVSSILADYGYNTFKPNEIWEEADFLAQHINGETCLRVHLKNRLNFHKKYLHRDLYICFQDKNDWYLIPHDEVLRELLNNGNEEIANSTFWTKTGNYSFPSLGINYKKIIENYKL